MLILAGDINFSINSGGTNHWRVANTVVAPVIVGDLVGVTTGAVVTNTGTQNTRRASAGTTVTNGNYVLRTTGTTGLLTFRTNTAASPTLASINFSINNGVSNQWSILGSGVLTSTIAGANILMSNSQNITLSDVATTTNTVISPALVTYTDPSGVASLSPATLSITRATPFPIRNFSGGLQLITNTADIAFSTNNGGSTAWTMGATSGILSSTSATANISLTNSQEIRTSNAALTSFVATTPGLVKVQAATGEIVDFATSTITRSGTAGGLRLINTSGFLLYESADYMDFRITPGLNVLSLIAGGPQGLIQFGAANLASCPFLATDASRVIIPGTVLAISAGGTGSASGPTVSTIQGGAAGQVVYQSGVNVTAFTNTVAGVLQSTAPGATPAFTTTPTTIATITAPAASNLLLTTTATTKEITLKTFDSPIKFSIDNGVSTAWSVSAGGDLVTFNNQNLQMFNGGVSGVYDSSGIVYGSGNALIKQNSGGLEIKLQTVSGGLKFSTDDGVSNAWTMAATTGILSSATADINLTASSKIVVGFGAGNNTTIQGGLLTVAIPGSSTTIGGTLMNVSGTHYAYKVSGGFSLGLETVSGDINFSTDSGATKAIVIQTGLVKLPAVLSAPFLTTSGTGVITAGTILAVANGGTGVSSVTKPKVTLFGTGNITLTGVCKYFTVEICGGGGGGGGSSTVSAAAGGGGGAGTDLSYFLYNGTAGYYSVTLGAAGAGGVGSNNGGTGGNTDFVANAIIVMQAIGGVGGVGTSTVNTRGGSSGTGGLGDIKNGGGDGGWGIGTLGGTGGACLAGGGTTHNISGSGSYTGFTANYNGGGGCGGNNGDGGAGRIGQCTVTEYYY